MILLNVLVDAAILACLAGLAIWAWRRSQADRAHHRAVVREIGRLRMAERERDSMDLSRMANEIRALKPMLATRLDEVEKTGYCHGYADGADQVPGLQPPRLRAVD